MTITASAAREEDSEATSSRTGFAEPSSSEEDSPDVQASAVGHARESRVSDQDESTSVESAGFEAAALSQVLKIVGSVVAPTTLLTALLFYFGRLHVTGFFRYFGVNFTVLDLTVQDYLVRSADGLFVPLTIAAAAALLALWAHRLLLRSLRGRNRRIALRALAPLAAIAGLVLVSVAIVTIFSDTAVLAAYPEVHGLSLAIGVLLLAYGVRLVRLLSAKPDSQRGGSGVPGADAIVEWGAIFVLVSVGLFWAVGSYAIGVGTGRGQEMEAALPSWPDAVLYSDESLNLQAPGVRETPCQNPTGAYRFRYDGLKLVLQSGNQYLFLPEGWTPAAGAAVLIPRTEALRLEFSAAGLARSAAC